MQTDDVLRTYPEYQFGFNDGKEGLPDRSRIYPLINSGGRFIKKAYILGRNDARKAEPIDG